MPLQARNKPPPDREQSFQTLKHFSSLLASIPDLKSLGREVLGFLTKTTSAQGVSLFLLDEEKGGFRLAESLPPDTATYPSTLLTKEDPLVQEVSAKGEVLLRDEVLKRSPPAADLGERMGLLQAAVVFPLAVKGELVGMICLDSKAPPKSYGWEEVDLLSVLTQQAAVALESRWVAEELKRSKSHIQRADRLASLGTLTAALAHEIRNPLVAIKTFTQLLPERFGDEEFRSHFLHIVSGEVDRISSLINELLEFARPSDPKVQAEDVNAILDAILLLVSTGTRKKHIHISKAFAGNLPRVPIDREQMKQVFLNILINAIEATAENGEIAVTTRPYIKPGGDSYVQIEVSDTGCGIPPEYLESIFNPFFTTKHKGSGLGLSISNQIVQEHQGFIDVESRPNNGSTFFVNLPLHRDRLPGKRGAEGRTNFMG